MEEIKGWIWGDQGVIGGDSGLIFGDQGVILGDPWVNSGDSGNKLRRHACVQHTKLFRSFGKNSRSVRFRCDSKMCFCREKWRRGRRVDKSVDWKMWRFEEGRLGLKKWQVYNLDCLDSIRALQTPLAGSRDPKGRLLTTHWYIGIVHKIHKTIYSNSQLTSCIRWDYLTGVLHIFYTYVATRTHPKVGHNDTTPVRISRGKKCRHRSPAMLEEESCLHTSVYIYDIHWKRLCQQHLRNIPFWCNTRRPVREYWRVGIDPDEG